MSVRRAPTVVRLAPGTEMMPELRALADRFIYEQATIKHIIASIPDEALARKCEGFDGTVGELLGHLGWSLGDHAEVVRAWLADEALPASIDPDRDEGQDNTRFTNATRPELSRDLGIGLINLFAVLSAIPDERLDEQLGEQHALESLGFLSEHCMYHAIALIDACPEVRMDPLVLNWLLHEDFADGPELQWQQALLDEANAYIAARGDSMEEDDV